MPDGVRAEVRERPSAPSAAWFCNGLRRTLWRTLFVSPSAPSASPSATRPLVVLGLDTEADAADAADALFPTIDSLATTAMWIVRVRSFPSRSNSTSYPVLRSAVAARRSRLDRLDGVAGHPLGARWRPSMPRTWMSSASLSAAAVPVHSI